MSNVMLKLGGYKFGIDSAAYQELTRRWDFRWTQQDRIKRLPAQQFVGLGASTISMNGTIYPEFKGSLEQVQAMAEEAAKGKPLLMVDSIGRDHGYWCIKSLEEKTSHFLNDGLARKSEFSVELIEYGEDGS